jgi:predicted nucleic acid-binding Zn finger protein
MTMLKKQPKSDQVFIYLGKNQDYKVDVYSCTNNFGRQHSLHLILSFSKSIIMQLKVLKMVKKKQVPSFKKEVYESMDKVTGKPKELPILVQYLGIKN